MDPTIRSVELRSIAQDVADALPASVEEVVLTGSVSRGVADDVSDIEMLVVTSDEPDLEECFGCRVVNAYHVPVVPPRPGIGVFFNRRQGRNNLVVSWCEGVVSEAEATRIIDVVRDGMGWSRIA